MGAKAECYLVIEGRESLVTPGTIKEARIVRMTKTKPDLQASERMVKIELDLPHAFFLDSVPVVQVDVPAPDPQDRVIVANVKPRQKSEAAKAVFE